MIEVQQLRKIFQLSSKQQKLKKINNKVKIAVEDVSFIANNGEIIGILGANGAGKTTILRILATVIKADSGKVKFNNNDIYDDIVSYRKNIGFMSSEMKLDSYFTPNYMFEYFAKLYEIENVENRKQELFEKFGIEKFADVKIGNLSTGMKQKVSLVTSIVHNPEVIIFDEPTNGLDIITEKIVIDFLLDLRNQGKCIILSSHIFSLVEKLCDKIVFIVDGRSVLEDRLDGYIKCNLEKIFFDLYGEIV